MTDWLAVWGVANTAGFLFRDTLRDLAAKGVEDYVKFSFREGITKLADLAKEKPLEKAYGQGLKEFLALVQQELEDGELEPDEIKTYNQSLKQFINHESVCTTLALAFEEAIGKYTASSFSISILARTWQDGDFKSLPDNFNWEQLGKRYLDKVKVIVQESDELRKLFDTENLAKIREILDNNTPPRPDFNLERYRKNILDHYSRLRLDSLDTRDENHSQDSSKILLRNLELWQIFVPQHLVEEGKQERLSVLSLLQNQENQEENDYPYLVILGNPGSGKSTLAQYRALTWARKKDFSVAQELPLIIELKCYSDNRRSSGHNFLAYLAQGHGVMGKLNHQGLTRWFKENKTLLIFDGLDEILDKREREKTVREIIDFKNTYPQVRILITSRVVGYEKKQEQSRLINAGFRQFWLQDLDEEQIKDFLAKWHKFAFENETEGLRKQERLLKALARNQKYQGLAGNPLLLTMMAILNRYNDLPNDKASLYEDASKVLLERWEADKNFGIDEDLQLLDVRDKQEILRKVAFCIQEQHSSLAENLFIEKEDLRKIIAQQLETQFAVAPQESQIKAKRLLDRLTSRNFLVCLFGDNKYGFVHRTFLEYFCAWYWVWQFEKVRTVDLEGLKEKAIMGRWQDESWHEVISLIVGTIHESHGVSLVEYLIHEDGAASGWLNLVLAEKCLTEARSEIKISVGARRRYNVLTGQDF